MLKQRNVLIIVLPLLLVGFIFGLTRLFQLRLEHGDIYPPYSSLRSDPLGTKIFYKSLQKLRDIDATRLYEPLRKVDTGRGKTLFLIGTSPEALNWVPRSDLDEIEAFARNGGRVVIALSPVNTNDWRMRQDEKKLQEKKQGKTKLKKSPTRRIKPGEDEPDAEVVSLFKKWDLFYGVENLESSDEGVAQPVNVTRISEDDSLSEHIVWHSGFYFRDLTNQWNEIYRRETNQAVVITRKFGSGQIVLATDSYLFSNEAMRHDRQSALLVWFTGDNREVIFDETHLGVEADPGIAALARKYRLHGMFIGLLLLAGLFVWKNATGFIPAPDDDIFEGRSAVISGKESSAGFVNLLRRSVSPAEIITACFDEWKKSSASLRAKSGKKFAQVETLVQQENSLSARERQPLKVYHAISTILTERK